MKNEILNAEFKKIYNYEPTKNIRCGGRFEVLGNHTDHNHGKCIAATCGISIYSAVSKREDNIVKVYSKGYGEFKVDLNELEIKEEELGKTPGLIRGVASYLKNHSFVIGGLDIYMESEIFPGAGVSSSAAFELLIGQIFNEFYNDNKIDRLLLAKAGQYAENNYYGKKSGLLDQIGVAYGGMVYIDFSDIDNPKVEPLKVDTEGYEFILVNTGGDHTTMSHLYSQIPLDMYTAAKAMNHNFLIEGSLDELEQIKDKIEERVYLRAKHFYLENERVLKAETAIKNKDSKTLIKLMNESRKSSAENLKNMMVENSYVGSPLEACSLVDTLTDNLGAAKINGGGFAGSIVTLVPQNKKDNFIKVMKEKYGDGNVYVVAIDHFGVGDNK
ncbi:MAG: galactokinase [Bacilli bacterium]